MSLLCVWRVVKSRASEAAVELLSTSDQSGNFSSSFINSMNAAKEEFQDVLCDQLPSAVCREGGEFLKESVLSIPFKPGTQPLKFRHIPLSAGEGLVIDEKSA